MKEYFAGGNTADGFINYLPYAAEGRKRIWILRGCPGCGKSTFMRRIYALASEQGCECELIRCSSDPQSLDGVVIPEMSFAVFDGTAPHTLGVKYPLVLEREIDLSAFSSEPANCVRQAVTELSDRKKALYRRGYMLLRSAELLKNAFHDSAAEYIRTDKLRSFVSRRLKCVRGFGRDTHMQVTSFGGNGCIRLDGIDHDNAVYIKDSGFGISELLFRMIYESTQGCERVLSFDPLSAKRYTDIYLKGSGILFTASPVENAKAVNDMRFLTPEGRRKLTKEKKEMLRRFDTLCAQAQSLFSAAALLHREIEAYYMPLMDFETSDEYQRRLLSLLPLS